MPLPPPLPRKNWFERNWKWFVPLTGTVFLTLLILFFVGIFFFVTKVMTSSPPYMMAMETAQQDPRAQELLGSPIKRRGWFVMGNFTSTGSTGRADLSIPVEGPKARGTLIVEAELHRDGWELLYLGLDTGNDRERLVMIGTDATAE